MDDIRPRGSGVRSRPVVFRRPPGTPAQKPSSSQPKPQPQPKLSHDDDFDFFDRPKVSSVKLQPKPKKKKKRSKQPLLIFILILLLAGGGAVGYWYVLKPRLNKPAPAISNQSAEDKQPEPQKLTGNFRIVATGDMITHDSVNQNAKQADGSFNYAPMLSEIKPLLEKSQTRICHNTVPAGGVGMGISGYPSFNAPTELIGGFATSGCNILSLASDHINDKGQGAIDATLTEIDKQKDIVINSGANRSAEHQNRETTFNVGDGALKMAYFSYTTRQASAGSTPFGVNVYNKEFARSQIGAWRDKVDFILVSMCWGREDSGDVDPAQESIAQELSELGADVVFGHCTHVVQPVKTINSSTTGRQTTVYYSLGNALNSQLPIETLIGGFAVIDIDLETKKITSAGFLPTYMHYEWTAAEKTAKTLNARKNLKLYPLDKADAVLAASQNGTTSAAQTDRIKGIVNKLTPVKMLTSADFQ